MSKVLIILPHHWELAGGSAMVSEWDDSIISENLLSNDFNLFSTLSFKMAYVFNVISCCLSFSTSAMYR